MNDSAKRSVVMRASVSEIAGEDVSALVGAGRYAAVKRRDDHPMFVKLIVGYEGVSRGAMTVEGQTVNQAKRWFRTTIDELADALNFGSPGLFEGHENKGTRKRLGEIIVGYSEDDSKHRRSAYGIAYVKDKGVRPRIKSGELDACSVEADVVIAGLETDEPFVQAVEGCDGVVLADGKKAAPGFAEAGVDAVISELCRHGKVAEMNKKDLEGTERPSDIFSRNELAEDSVVRTLIDQGRGKQYDDLVKAKDELSALKSQGDEKDQEIKRLQGELKAAGTTANSGRISKLVDERVDALKLTTPEKAEIKVGLKTQIQVEDPKISDDDLGKTVDAAVRSEEERVQRFRRLYGKPADAGDSGARDDGNGDGDTAGDTFLDANKLEVKGDDVVPASA